ncbi:TetR family transcriptional regulator [Cellulosimicrobium cellulans]|uniref:TetR/AcrR family transcriptional regulator n=1 Tax=Cellulosimicrobium cellulans TaxID=1710 RepID=UPI0019641007|nr:TetR/AcrR family transcriptional regulator [Cellulosimicrobium cellulans]MBN0039200.1 TetR family transcriptional regulator [Cellulosimicrobium cellulans]
MRNEDGLWDRSRRAVYAEITRVAMELFLDQGFAETTIDQIASRAGISRRSFFRYFGTKEDIVLGDLVDQGALVRAALEAIPLSVPPWQALQEALWEVDRRSGAHDTALKTARMMYETPSLRARSIEKHLRWQELLVPNIRQRLGIDPDDESDPAADAIVASAIACLDVAGQIWARSNGSVDLEEMYRKAADAVQARTHYPDQRD